MDANAFSCKMSTNIFVSIHAPVMDANNLIIEYVLMVSFNPRARDGREHQWAQFDHHDTFQSTRP